MRKYQSREATESQPALSPPKETRKRATPSAASGKAAPAGTAARERPCAGRPARVIARIPSLATSDPARAAEGRGEAEAGWLSTILSSTVLSRKVVLGGVVLLVSCAVVTAIWQFNGGTEKKDSSATATYEPGPGTEMHASSTSAAPWAGAAADATAGPGGARRRPERAGQAASGRYSPYEAAEAALPPGAAARWDDPSDALPTATEYRENGDPLRPNRHRMALSYGESLEAERPEPGDAEYAPSSSPYPVHRAIGDAERWLAPGTGPVSREPAGSDDRPTTSRQSGPEYRTASRPGGLGWQSRHFGSSDGSYPSTDYPATGLPKASAGPRSGVRSGVNPAPSARDAGAARLDGIIQTPPTRTSSYERTGPGLY